MHAIWQPLLILSIPLDVSSTVDSTPASRELQNAKLPSAVSACRSQSFLQALALRSGIPAGPHLVPATKSLLCDHPHGSHVELMRGMRAVCKSRGWSSRRALNMRQIYHCQTATLTNSITEPAVRARCVSATCKFKPVRNMPRFRSLTRFTFSKLIFGCRWIAK